MSTTAGPTLYKFAVWAPDMTDPEAFSRRMAVRESHLVNAKSLFANGVLKFGGGLLSPESIASPTAEKKLVGSMMVFEADSVEAVRKVIESDLYYQNGVWDKEKLQIFPWLQANL
ncbi:uncharacterized protein C8Q71DRAFT_725699 [Rhodofomes roseus]|uniref:YCII-related domain-containing protein n=1 Tax=Rhodofomes roseus TaxID=34475 RepID=A0ABQ8K850_9APHY|nr:uncharacterized protein C8Q71DRAFT_725699 [Rhodofomes roseus]KAH9833476.1 hypothetical protein C8Q71DRAFT_725699 [Rhodofomes roseus]